MSTSIYSIRTAEEIMLDFLVWDMRINAYKKYYNNKQAKDVYDALSEEEAKALVNIYDRINFWKTYRQGINPTVQKLIAMNDPQNWM